MDTCSTCCKPAGAPYRSGERDARGRIVHGCVDAFHTGHLHGESAFFHNRPEAKSIRAAWKAHRKAVLGSSRDQDET